MKTLNGLLKTGGVSDLYAEISKVMAITFKPSEDVSWGSYRKDDKSAVVYYNLSANHPRECMLHELLHLDIQIRGYKNIRIGFSELYESDLNRLIEALDNELQHHLIYSRFIQLGGDGKHFYNDEDVSTGRFLDDQLSTGYSHEKDILIDYLTAIAPGGAFTHKQKEDYKARFRKASTGKFLDEIDTAIISYKKGNDYNPEEVVRKIFHSFSDPKAKNTWFGFSTEDRPPAKGFFTHEPFSIKEDRA